MFEIGRVSGAGRRYSSCFRSEKGTVMQTETSDHAAQPPHAFPVGVVYNGKEKHESVKLVDLIKDVLAGAIKIFQVTQQPHMLSLFDENGNELNDNTTVGDNGITPKSVLYLRQSKVKGGGA
jgi:hypothetical protein